MPTCRCLEDLTDVYAFIRLISRVGMPNCGCSEALTVHKLYKTLKVIEKWDI